MMRTVIALVLLLSNSLFCASTGKQPTYPSFDYDVARTHGIKPHCCTVPLRGVQPGFNQLHLTLTVSPVGDVINAEASANDKVLKFWPQLQEEVNRWKFTPFEKNGTAVTAEVEEYIDLVPPERLPKVHVAAPTLLPTSQLTITLARSGCFGSCPSYKVAVSTDGVVFDGNGYAVASGRHTDAINAKQVRTLAKKFLTADFYSMDASYAASVTDMPGYRLSIAIDGRIKEVADYVGSWEGMPAIITELEDEVDTLARTDRWIDGGDGLAAALQAGRNLTSRLFRHR